MSVRSFGLSGDVAKQSFKPKVVHRAVAPPVPSVSPKVLYPNAEGRGGGGPLPRWLGEPDVLYYKDACFGVAEEAVVGFVRCILLPKATGFV